MQAGSRTIAPDVAITIPNCTQLTETDVPEQWPTTELHFFFHLSFGRLSLEHIVETNLPTVHRDHQKAITEMPVCKTVDASL